MECPVCLDSFTDPVVLPCGHTLCRASCARGLVKGDCLKCPTCRTVHWVPDGVDGLPKNYALQEFMEQPDGAASVPDERLTCTEHPEDRVSMLCVQCCQPVCLRCYIVSSDGVPPQHFQHEVIRWDSASDYLQSALSTIGEYLLSRQAEEISNFENLSAATVDQQEMLKKGRSCVQKERQRLLRLVDDRSEALLGQLQAWATNPDLPGQSQAVLERIMEYNSLGNQCQNLIESSENTDGKAVWQKCEDFKRLLQQVERLPPSSDIPAPHQFCSAGTFVLNTEFLKQAIHRSLTLDIEAPSPPIFSLEDCVFADSSAAIAWVFSVDDHVNYFTVYYETAIFVRGQCNDCQSFDVTDFGQTKAQTTIRDLQRGHRYRLHVVARNNAGASPRSQLLYFKCKSGDSDVKVI